MRERADHLYDFTKRRVKWRLLERNRCASIVRTYPWELLVLLLPALALTELGLLVIALRGGWVSEKLGALWDTLRWMPRLIGERRAIQSQRAISAGEFAAYLTADLSSPYLGAPARSRILAGGLRAYWALVCMVLRLAGSGGVSARFGPGPGGGAGRVSAQADGEAG
jgi:hypothetical protein